jgi:hypothetical protein
MVRFEILPGLPPYGPMALPIPMDGQGSFREGFVVRFYPDGSEPWVGNFQHYGFTSFPAENAVLPHPNDHDVIVIAGGIVYVVDPDARTGTKIHSSVIFSEVVPSLPAVVLGTCIDFMVVCRDTVWRSPRMSADGFRNLSITGTVLSGEAAELDDSWVPIEIDIKTGICKGTPYEPYRSPRAIEITPKNAAKSLGRLFAFFKRNTKPNAK